MVPYGGSQQQYPGAPPPPQQQYGAQQQNPYGAPPPGQQQQQQQQPDQNPFGAPAPGGAQQNPYGAPAPAQQWGAPAPGATPFDAPAPVDTAPGVVNTQPQPTPSTIGFGSPQPAQGDFSSFQTPAGAPGGNDFAGQYGGDQGFAAPAPAGPSDPFSSPAPQQSQQQQQQDQSQQGPPQQEEQAPAPPPAGVTLTMNSLAGDSGGLLGNTNGGQTSGSLADQAYAKFATMDQFDLMSKKDAARENPFEAAPVGGQQSLADMKKNQKVCLKVYISV